MKLTVNSGCETTDSMISAVAIRQRQSENVHLYVGLSELELMDSATHLIILYKNEAYLQSEHHLSLVKRFGKRCAALSLPLSLRELDEAIAEVISQTTNISDPAPSFVYDKERRTLSRENKSVTLSAKESLLLEYFISNKGRFISREELRCKLWQNTDNTNAPDVYVAYLRRKLSDVLGDGVIINVRGKGYMFSANE